MLNNLATGIHFQQKINSIVIFHHFFKTLLSLFFLFIQNLPLHVSETLNQLLIVKLDKLIKAKNIYIYLYISNFINILILARANCAIWKRLSNAIYYITILLQCFHHHSTI